jgi:hypothetical protein
MVRQRLILVVAAAAALMPTMAFGWGTFPSAVVSFEEGCVDATTCKEIFRAPQTSGSTQGIVVNVTGEDNNTAFRTASPLVGASEGLVAYQVNWAWTNTTDPDAWVRLTTIGTADRPNPSLDMRGKVRFKIANVGDVQAFGTGAIGLVIGIRETDVPVPQLADGGVTGAIEWVGVDPTVNAIVEPEVGGDGLANTTAAGDDVQVIAVGQPALPGDTIIGPGGNGMIDTAPAGDDFARFGYVRAANGTKVPLPVVTLAPSPVYYAIEIDLMTGDITVDGGTPIDGAIAGFTGDGVLSTPSFRGTLEHIGLTNVTTDTGVNILMYIDEVQFEATEPDPVVAPVVVSPIVNGDVSVTVTNIIDDADVVTLNRDGLFDRDCTIGVDCALNGDDVVFDITDDPAVTDQEFSAKQRNGVSLIESPESAAVTVLAQLPPYTFSLIVDESGSGSCSTAAPSWEWVGVTSVIPGSAGGTFSPQGASLNSNDAVWQAVDVRLDNDDLILPTSGIAGGDGALIDSPTGFYTLDSLWFTAAGGTTPTGPWEVLVDRITYVDANEMEGPPLLTMEDGASQFSGVRGQSPTLISSTANSTLGSFDGTRSHRLLWSYGAPVDNADSIGILQRFGTGGCNSSIFVPDDAVAIRFYMVLRGQPTSPGVPLPTITGPIIAGTQDSVRVGVDATAVEVQLYINGEAAGAPVALSAQTSVDFTGLTLNPGDSVSAKQTLPPLRGVEPQVSDFAYPRGVTSQPLPPSVTAPVLPSATSVTVTNVLAQPFATASVVTVYVNGVPGTPVATGGLTSVNVTIPAAQPLQSITATQTVNGEESDESLAVTVSVPAPVIYYAPAAGDTTVRVTSVADASTSVTVVNTTTLAEGTLNLTPGPENKTVDVTVAELNAGDVLVAYQTAAGVDSANSATETATVGAVTNTIWCDTFEYADQAAFNALWTPVGTNSQLQLSTLRNATVGGAKSMLSPATPPNYRSSRGVMGAFTATDLEPIVWNVTIWDPGVTGVNHYSDLNNNAGSAQLCEIGMTTLGPGATQTHYQARIVGNGGPNWVHLDQFDGPTRSTGWHVFTMVIKGPADGFANRHEIDVYVDGKLARKGLQTTSLFQPKEPRIGAGFASAAAGSSFDDYCAEVGPIRFNEVTEQPPLPPTLDDAVEVDSTTITVSGVAATATVVEVFANGGGSPIGSIDPAGAPTVDVPITGHVQFDSLTATQTTSGGTSVASSAIEVGDGNGDIFVSLGIRETGDAGPLGSPGTGVGSIEWIGATSTVSGAPQGIALSVSPNWQTVTFDPTGDVLSFLGNGVIDGTRGTLEHLAVAVNAGSAGRSSGIYSIYIDNVVNVGAGEGGADVVITDFEGFAENDEVLFQEPTFSGSTAANLTPLPSASENRFETDNGGAASQRLTMFFRDTTAARWARITTGGTANVPAPIIDLTKPIRMDILLAEVIIVEQTGACDRNDGTCSETLEVDCLPYVCDVTALAGQTCFADADANGTVNAADRGQISANIGQTSNDLLCRFDLDGNGVVNAADRGQVSANIGLCNALPAYQNGDGPDPRYTATWQGAGTTCD